MVSSGERQARVAHTQRLQGWKSCWSCRRALPGPFAPLEAAEALQTCWEQKKKGKKRRLGAEESPGCIPAPGRQRRGPWSLAPARHIWKSWTGERPGKRAIELFGEIKS